MRKPGPARIQASRPGVDRARAEPAGDPQGCLKNFYRLAPPVFVGVNQALPVASRLVELDTVIAKDRPSALTFGARGGQRIVFRETGEDATVPRFTNRVAEIRRHLIQIRRAD